MTWTCILWFVSAAAIFPQQKPVFYRNVLPILQRHCQTCHRSGEIAPMPLVTYRDTRKWAQKIGELTRERKMPPWFADPQIGRFSNDPSLSAAEISTLSTWAAKGAPAGRPADAPSPPGWPSGWNISQPDLVLRMPVSIPLPAEGDIDYTYEIVPTRFTTDRWVRMCEVRPDRRDHVHHAVVYIRPPGSNWLRHAPVGAPFTAKTLADPQDRRDAMETDSDMLIVYAPGSSPERWGSDMGKLVPAGSDLVFQMHYTTNGHAAHDRTSVGIVFASQPPKERVLTLQLNNRRLMIPPGADDFRVEVWGTLPNDATLISFFPHMHLRGKRFEYNIIGADGAVETLLRVHWDFHWQMSYILARPRLLKAGTKLQAVAWYDNSKNNPHNPDPNRLVTWGDQTTDEMMVGFFDVAVPANVDKWQFFIRHQGN